MKILERSAFGWQLTTASRLVARTVIVPAVVAGALMVFSIWLVMFGVPLLAAGYVALVETSSHQHRERHPSRSMFGLAVIELVQGALVIWMFGLGVGTAAFLLPGIITATVGAWLLSTASPARTSLPQSTMVAS